MEARQRGVYRHCPPPGIFPRPAQAPGRGQRGADLCFRDETAPGSFEESRYCYENGIVDYLAELVGEDALTAPYVARAERQGRDREDKPLYKVKFEVAFAFSTRVQRIEYYHNSSFLEHGGSPDKAVRSAFVSAIDAHLKAAGKYNKNESKITFADVADCLVLISNSHSTRTSYENQTKKAINNKFIADSMTAFLKEQLEIYFLKTLRTLGKSSTRCWSTSARGSRPKRPEST